MNDKIKDFTFLYPNNPFKFKRFKTQVVNIGGIPMGGNHPIRIQSMTNTDTTNVDATLNQIIKLSNAGCHYVRVTASTDAEVEALGKIKKALERNGYNIPIIADVHFNPDVAMKAAAVADKVRINPGNYIDKKNFQQLTYTEQEYEDEIHKIRERLIPLLRVCNDHKTALRIGVNHGSLSDRIVSRYGDTSMGMVESALEFARICNRFGFTNLVISLKASDVKLMVHSYRLLVYQMKEENISYPLHIGVTEAGEGDYGIIKSAMGIGSLLEDGIGDTIRVSLTGNPTEEIPVALEIANRYNLYNDYQPSIKPIALGVHPFEYKRRETIAAGNIGGNNPPVFITNYIPSQFIIPTPSVENEDTKTETDTTTIKEFKLYPDYVSVSRKDIKFEIPKGLGIIQKNRDRDETKDYIFPKYIYKDFKEATNKSDKINFIFANCDGISAELLILAKRNPTAVIVIDCLLCDKPAYIKRTINKFYKYECMNPVVVKITYDYFSEFKFKIYSAIDMGYLLVDGIVDGLWLYYEGKNITETGFNILQASGSRRTKTEYIACPTCGRTKYDVQKVLQEVKAQTQHLAGLKIAVMGCIVNGLGEMGDADYGYIGTATGNVNLYKGKDLIKKNIVPENAIKELVDLIKENGDWAEPNTNS